MVDETIAPIYPAGDGSYLDVLIRDQFNAPTGGVFVKSTFAGAEFFPGERGGASVTGHGVERRVSELGTCVG